jgi:putative ABC transport system permease protein
MLRATLKSLLSRKLRLTLSGLAIVLGVMFVSGAFVLTDTVGRSFNNLFADIYEYTDIDVSKPSDVGSIGGGPPTADLPAADVARVQAVPGVDRATGLVFVDGARVIGKNGKVVTGSGGPRFGANWVGETELIAIRGDGRGPTSDTEIAISANLAKSTGYGVGDQVKVIPPRAGSGLPFTVVGITEYSGGRDSLAGEMTVFFNEPTAQRLMLGEVGLYSSIDVRIDDGANVTEVRDRIASTLGEGYNVKTGEQLTQESSEGLQEGLAFFNYLLLGFAAVALFVGVFLILNTFSIIVAQRTRELALFRAMGASRNQVIRSVLTEAVVIGTLASVVGLIVGIGVGALLGRLLGSALSGGALRLAGFGVPPAAIISAFVVGVGITVVAALLPALRASRIPPVAAMQDVATPDRPLTKLTVLGAIVLAAGGTVLGLGLAGELGEAGLWGVLGGLLTCFIGVALLTPLVSRPVVAVLGRAFGRRASGTLGRRNSARNPRRTAITAAALMVGIALITGISVIFSSIRESTVKAVDQGIHAELAISGDTFAASLPAFEPKTMQDIRQLSDVESAVGFYGDLARVNGSDEFLVAADDLPAALPMFDMDTTAGSLTPLESGHVIVDDKTAADRNLTVGSTITVAMAKAAERTFTIQGIYSRTAVNNGFFLSVQDATGGFRSPTLVQGYVKLKPGANVDTVRGQVDQLLRDSPEVSVAKVDDFVAQQAQIFDFVLIFVQMLLGLAMIIAVLGIINTLALSTFERTRELGLLRAVGMKQGQVMWMVTVESVVISVFGAILGIVVGVGLGVAVFQALREEGFTDLAFPWPLMVGYLVASVFVGLIAALIPAIRAARLDVLKAIAYE